MSEVLNGGTQMLNSDKAFKISFNICFGENALETFFIGSIKVLSKKIFNVYKFKHSQKTHPTTLVMMYQL